MSDKLEIVKETIKKNNAIRVEYDQLVEFRRRYASYGADKSVEVSCSTQIGLESITLSNGFTRDIIKAIDQRIYKLKEHLENLMPLAIKD